MTVPKTGVDSLSPRGQSTAETEGTSQKGGEFEAVLEEKADTRAGKKRVAQRRGAGAGTGIRPGSGQDRSDRGRGGDGVGSERTRTPARNAAAQHALKEAEGSGGPGEDAGRGGLAGPAQARLGQTEAATADAASATDATARLERIAQQIVQAAEVRLHGDGTVEARLQLDLGRLGRMHVALERSADGQIRVTLEPTSAEARNLLEKHGQELANRLEARGVNLQELTVQSSGETLLRFQGAREGTETTAARTSAQGSETTLADHAAEPERPPQREHSQEEHERRGRRDPGPDDEEEEG